MVFRKRAMLLVLYVGMLYLFIPYGRQVVLFLRERNLLRFAVAVSTVLVLLAIGRALYLHSQASRARVVLTTAGIGAFYFLLFYFVDRPEERLHFVQYGLLAPLTVYVFSAKFKGPRLFIVSVVIALILAAGDETIQYFTPTRVFEWQDMHYNLAAVMLGMSFLKIAQRILNWTWSSENLDEKT